MRPRAIAGSWTSTRTPRRILAKTLGKSRSHVANMMRLLALPAPVKQLIDDGLLSAGHARALLATDDPERLARRVIDRGLNVRQTEQLVNSMRSGGRHRAHPPVKDADTLALERDLGNALGLSVEIKFHGSKGSLVLHYTSLDQLDDILHRLSRGTHGRRYRHERRGTAPANDPLVAVCCGSISPLAGTGEFGETKQRPLASRSCGAPVRLQSSSVSVSTIKPSPSRAVSQICICARNGSSQAIEDGRLQRRHGLIGGAALGQGSPRFQQPLQVPGYRAQQRNRREALRRSGRQRTIKHGEIRSARGVGDGIERYGARVSHDGQHVVGFDLPAISLVQRQLLQFPAGDAPVSAKMACQHVHRLRRGGEAVRRQVSFDQTAQRTALVDVAGQSGGLALGFEDLPKRRTRPELTRLDDDQATATDRSAGCGRRAPSRPCRRECAPRADRPRMAAPPPRRSGGRDRPSKRPPARSATRNASAAIAGDRRHQTIGAFAHQALIGPIQQHGDHRGFGLAQKTFDPLRR